MKHKMKKQKREHGAVTIFLCIILVPCLAFSSIFVELGRLYMSKSMAVSAADTAMNALLTNYDSVLNDWYGMVASCQNIDEFYDVSEDFFERMLQSQGLSDDEITSTVNQISSYFDDEEIHDLLQVETVEDTVSIAAVSDANLTDGALIKDQIIEFMKYRAPVEITIDIVDRLSESSSAIESTQEAEENDELIETKENYYESESELLQQVFDIYENLYSYEYSASENGFTNDTIQTYVTNINAYLEAYQEIHSISVEYLLNSQDFNTYSRYTYALHSYDYLYTEPDSDIYSSIETVDDVEIYYIDEEKLIELTEDLNEKIDKFNEAITSFETVSTAYTDLTVGGGDSQADEFQWYVQFVRAANIADNDIPTTAVAMLKAYSELLTVEQCEYDDDVTTDTTDAFEEALSTVENLQYKFLQAGVEDSSSEYLTAVNELESITTTYLNKSHESTYSVGINGTAYTLPEALSLISTNLTDIKEEVDGYIGILDIAIDGSDDVPALSSLLTAIEKYNSEFETFKTTAENTDTTMGEEVVEEVEDIEEDYSAINSETIDELETRLINIRSQLQILSDYIDSMTYGETKIMNISTYSQFRTAADNANISADYTGITNKEISDYISSTSSNIKPSTNLVMSHFDDINYNPKLSDTPVPTLYQFFMDKIDESYFNGVNADKKKQAEDDFEDGEGDAEVSETQSFALFYSGDGTNITNSFSGSESFGLLDSFTGVYGFLSDIVSGEYTDLRDSLYATSYVMNMFSYDTYENEAKYQLYDEANEYDASTLTLSNYSSEYAKISDEWASEDATDNYNKTLTNKLINTDNNAAFSAEVEYILTGESTSKECVNSVYLDIFALKYSLNYISSFQNFWTGTSGTTIAIDSTSSLLSAATGGIVPAPVIKVVFLAILTLCETTLDLKMLDAGFPVEIYKSEDDWVLSIDMDDGITTLFNKLSGGGTNSTEEKSGLYYSDYLTVFVYLAFESGTALEDDMYQRIAEVIQTNLTKTTGATYSMEKSVLYFEFSADLEVDPLMLSLPYMEEYNEDGVDLSESFLNYSIEMIRGYS